LKTIHIPPENTLPNPVPEDFGFYKWLGARSAVAHPSGISTGDPALTVLIELVQINPPRKPRIFRNVVFDIRAEEHRQLTHVVQLVKRLAKKG